MAVFWAVMSLLLAAGNDFLFKLFNRKERSLGIFVMTIGVAWFAILMFRSNDFGVLPKTILWGCIAGFFSVVGNLLLIGAMKFQSAGVTSTIYRLNLVGVTVGAWLFFQEKLSLLQFAGIIVSLCAIIAFFPWKEKKSSSQDMKLLKLGLFLAVIASCLRAGMGLAYKQAFLLGVPESGFLVVNSLWWVVGGLLYTLIFELPKKMKFNPSVFKYGLISGVFVWGICQTTAFALGLGNASIVLPIAQMSFIPTFLLGVLFLKEKITVFKVTGAVLGIIGILMLTL